MILTELFENNNQPSRVKFQGVSEAMKPSDIPPSMRDRLTMRDIEAERPQGAFRYRVGDSEFMSLSAAQEYAAGTGRRVEKIGVDEAATSATGQSHAAKSSPKKSTSNPRIERILKQLRARHPQAQDDLEALIFDFRSAQAHDAREIDRLDRENDMEEADIERLEKILNNLKQQRALAEYKKSKNQ